MPQTEIIILASSWLAAMVIAAVLWRKDILAPGAFGSTESKQRDVWKVPPPVWFVCGAMTFLSLQFFQGLVAKLPSSVIGEGDTLQRKVMTETLAYSSAACLGVLMVYLVLPRTSEKTGLRFRWTDFGVGVWCMLLAAPFYLAVGLASQFIHARITGEPGPKVAHDTLKEILGARHDLWGWVRTVNVTLLVPVVEELIYRVFLGSCVLGLMGRTWPSIFISSAIFALAHSSIVPPFALPGLFVLGVALGVAYERTRRLGVPMVMHAIFNIANVIFAMSAR